MTTGVSYKTVLQEANEDFAEYCRVSESYDSWWEEYRTDPPAERLKELLEKSRDAAVSLGDLLDVLRESTDKDHA